MVDPIQIMTGLISILSGVKGLYDWISGNTIGDRLKRMEEQLGTIEVLSENIGLLHETEFRDTTRELQNLYEDTTMICDVVQPIQSALGTDIIVSQPLAAPIGVQEKLTRPELYLSNIQPITHQLHSESIKNLSVVPITFQTNSKQLVGFLKRGLIEDFLGCEYSPHVTPDRAFVQMHPLRDTLVTPTVLPDGRVSIECAYCKGDGREPYPDGKICQYYYINRRCSVCQGRRVVLLIVKDLLVKCPLCSGNGHKRTANGWRYNEKCDNCNGLGVIALTGSIRVINVDR